MKTISRISAVSAIVLSFCISSASAEVKVWRDAKTKMTVSYDDRWDEVTNQNPGDILTLRGPDAGYANGVAARDFAECKINVDYDGRFEIYPVHYSAPIQRLNFSQEYWDGYLSRYADVVVHKGTDNNGLGDGFASMVSASYTTAVAPIYRKRAIAFTSHFNNNVYTVECSAKQSAYHKWHNSFLSFIKSVDFHEGTNYALSGYYRDFIQDRTLKVRGPDMLDDTYFGIHQPKKPWLERIF